MDPQSLNNLDPKLKETYERVMGTTTPPVSPAAPTVTTNATPMVDTTTQDSSLKGPILSTDISSSPDTSIPTTPYTPDNLRFQAAIQTPLTNPIQQSPVGAAVPKQQSSMVRILFIAGAVVFFIVYTVFWVKIFNLPLPF